MAKLTAEKVKELRERYAKGEVTQQALADEEGVTRTAVYHALTGNSWRGAGGPLLDTSESGPGNAVLTAEKVKELRERYAEGGVTQKELAEEVGLSTAAINRALVGAAWAKAGGPIHASETSRMNEREVRAIRREAKAHPERSFTQIGRNHGYSRGAISALLHGHTWQTVPYADDELHPDDIEAREEIRQKATRAALSTLNREAAKEIRDAYDAGEAVRDLAEQFECSVGAIYDVIRGKTWSDAGGKTHEDGIYNSLTQTTVDEIRARAAKGESFSSISRDLNVSLSHVGRIVYNERWHDPDYEAPERPSRG